MDPRNEDQDTEIYLKTAADAKDAKAIQFFYKDEFEYCNANLETILKMAKDFEPFDTKDEPRHAVSFKEGGKQCRDENLISAMRSVGKYVIKEVGKKILTGDLNLTEISFPVKAMIAKSALERTFHSAIFFPLYVNRAFYVHNKIERFKMVITATIASFYVNCSFYKPLNPILGETVSGHMEDGTLMYAEQISHHPPISYFYAKNERYQYHGYYVYEAKSGLNSITLKNQGKRFVTFKDGQKIEYNFASECYSGTVMGVMKVETKGELIYIDKQNDIKAVIALGKVKKKPTDFFEGEIVMQGIPISQISGSYMGFIDFDGIRYWDIRTVQPFKVTIDRQHLQSDASQRLDLQLLQLLDIQGAQKEKEVLEQLQREDEKMRKQRKHK